MDDARLDEIEAKLARGELDPEDVRWLIEQCRVPHFVPAPVMSVPGDLDA